MTVITPIAISFSRHLNGAADIRRWKKDLKANVKTLGDLRYALRRIEPIQTIYLTDRLKKEVLVAVEKEIEDNKTLLEFGVPYELSEFNTTGRPRTPYDIALALLIVLDAAFANKSKLGEIYDFLKRKGTLDDWLLKLLKNPERVCKVRKRIPYPSGPKDWAPRYRKTLRLRIISEGKKETIKLLTDKQLKNIEREKEKLETRLRLKFGKTVVLRQLSDEY